MQESNSAPMCIHISNSTALLLQQANTTYNTDFVITPKETPEKGEWDYVSKALVMYLLINE